MKNSLFTTLLTGSLLLASCSSEEITPLDGQTRQAVITVSLPETLAALESRAGGHDDYVNSGKGSLTNQPNANVNFYVALYHGTNTTPIFSKVKGCDAATHSVTFTPTLVMGEDYRLVAWAEYADQAAAEAESTFDFTNIAVNQSLNDESNDAFFYSEVIPAAQTLSATLKRPFGKLRLVAEDYGTMNSIVGKDVESVKVTYKSARSTTFNAVTGEFADATVTTTEFSGDINTYSSETGGSKTLFADYIAVGPNGASMFPFDITVNYNDGTTFSRSFTDDIPVKRNCLTTLTGDFFTVTSELKLIIDENFDSEEIIGGQSALAQVAANGGYLTLSEDVTPTRQTNITASATIDLNGKTVANTQDIWNTSDNNEVWSLFSVQGKGNSLTLKGNGNVIAKENDCYAVDIRDGGKVVIEDGNYVGNIHAVYCHQGEVVIKGGTFSIKQKSNLAGNPDGYLINCYDANYKNGTAKVTIMGGTFIGFDPANNIAEDKNGTNFVADGYKSVLVAGTTDTYTVIPDDNTTAGTSVAVDTKSMEAAAAIENAKVYLVDNANGYTLPATIAQGVSIEGNGATLVVPLNQKLTADNVTIANAAIKSSVTAITNGKAILPISGTGVVLDNVTVDLTLTENGLQTLDGSSVTIKNSTFDATRPGRAIASVGTADVTLENCEFTGNLTYAYNGSGTLTAKNCSFHGWMSGWQKGGTFENCTFSYGNMYVPCAVCYGNTTFTNCTFQKIGYPAVNADGTPGNPMPGTKFGYDVCVSSGNTSTIVFDTDCKYDNGSPLDTSIYVRNIGDGKQEATSVTINGKEYAGDAPEFVASN